MKAEELLQTNAAEGERVVPPQSRYLQYEGRIDFEKEGGPLFVYPATSVCVRFQGSYLAALVTNYPAYWDHFMGVLIDGRERCVKLGSEGMTKIVLYEENETEKMIQDKVKSVHEMLLFKRQDSCHMVQFHGLLASHDVRFFPARPLSPRRMEVYGDSVSAGEVSEAAEYCGEPDPEHNGEYSNSYHSYAWMTARKLNARLHDIAQGGIALMDGCGYFMEPEQLGMESVFDKIQYQPQILQESPLPLGAGNSRQPLLWDFSRFVPQVILVAIGQNDAYPVDFCAEDYTGARAARWREQYAAFLNRLRGIHPSAHIICLTTILNHHENWDFSIDEVCRNARDSRLHHFLFRKNGKGTKGHIRKAEAEEMADELAAYIRRLGDNIWWDTSRLERVFARAAQGEALTIGFIGGSITQGSLASAPGLCYASLAYDWWRQTFPKADFTKINAGIGGTTSHFGVARVEEDLLFACPDVVFVEFSVNDEADAHFLECYEGLIRRILASEKSPAVILLYNCYYTDGHSAKVVHEEVARHYALPEVCMGDVIYPKIVSGEYQMSEITPDGLHPNNRGHAMLADIICEFLDENYHVFCEREAFFQRFERKAVPEDRILPQPLTANRYERARRLQNRELFPVHNIGFEADQTGSPGIHALFRNGWSADKTGAEIGFEVKASCLAIQYRRTIEKPSPKAVAILDGDEKHAVLLNGNFDEDWGDFLALDVLLEEEEEREHTVVIRIVEAEEVRTPFYLISLIIS